MSAFITRLREAVKKNETIDYESGNKDVLIFSDNNDKFNVNDKSNYKSSSNNELYDIKTIYFCWLNKDENTTEYISKCEVEKVSIIPFIERNDLISFIKSEIDSTPYLVTENEDQNNDTTAAVDTGVATGTKNATAETGSSIEGGFEADSKNGNVNAQSVTDLRKTGNNESRLSTKKRAAPETIEKVDYKESKKNKIDNDVLLKSISVHEIELIDHNKALRGTQKNNDFSNLIRECEYKILRPLKQNAKSSSSLGSSSKVLSHTSSKSKDSSRSVNEGSKNGVSKSSSKSSKSLISADSSQSLSNILKKKDPIIILSPSAISMLNMDNIKEFLEDGKFTSTENNNKGVSNSNSMLKITRNSKKFNRKIKFLIVNNVEKFFIKPEYWDRVVAVFTTGQEWQFKNYRTNKPNLLFQKIKGFYINYNGDVVPENIKNWNVQVISLDRNQRFKDRQISELMWESIERFMLSKGYK